MRHDEEALLLRQCLLEAASLGQVELRGPEVQIRFQDPPHDRPRFPYWAQALYVFRFQDLCLKVGRAGPNSRARFTTHHYTGSTAYSLPNVINDCAEPLATELSRGEVQTLEALPVDRVGEWVAKNCGRINILFPSDHPRTTAKLLEAVLQARFDPCYEGPRSG